MSPMKIDIRLLPVKAHYFFYFGGMSALWPYVNVFAKQLGISSAAVGFVFGAAPMAGTIAKPLFGAIADRFKKKKIMFLFFILLNLMSFSCMAFLEQKEPQRPVTFHCTPFQSQIRQCGASNAHCNETIIDTFKSIPERNLVSKKKDSGRVTVGSLAENCSVVCEIYSFANGAHFCSSISNKNNAPKMCRDLYFDRNASAASSSDEIDDQHDSHEVADDYYTHPDELYEYPTVLEFTAKIKMWDAVFLPELVHEDAQMSCLNLPIEYVTYKGAENEQIVLLCDKRSVLPYCFLNCSGNPRLNLHLERILEEVDIYDSVNFWLYGMLVIFVFVAMAVVSSIGDALCFQLLGDKPELYGKQRQYGAIGWGIFALLSGFLIDTYSGAKILKDYTPAFYLMVGLLVLDLIVSYKWDIKEFERPKSLRRNVSSLLTDLRIIVFIAACIIIGMCTGLQWNFLMWHVEDLVASGEQCDVHDNRTKTLQGLIITVQCFLGEVPFFYISGWVIKKLGHIHCITMVLAVFGLRFLAYAFVTNAWMILPVEIVQGLTFGVFYATMTSYANKVSPPGTCATVQGIFGSAFEGLGVAAGSLVGGLFFHAYGGRRAFLIFGVGSLVFALLHLVIMLVLGREHTYRNVPLRIRQPEGQEMRQITASNPEVDSE